MFLLLCFSSGRDKILTPFSRVESGCLVTLTTYVQCTLLADSRLPTGTTQPPKESLSTQSSPLASLYFSPKDRTRYKSNFLPNPMNCSLSDIGSLISYPNTRHPWQSSSQAINLLLPASNHWPTTVALSCHLSIPLSLVKISNTSTFVTINPYSKNWSPNVTLIPFVYVYLQLKANTRLTTIASRRRRDIIVRSSPGYQPTFP